MASQSSGGEQLLRRVERLPGDHARRDPAPGVEDAARLEQLPLGRGEPAGGGRHRLPVRVHGLERPVDERLQLARAWPAAGRCRRPRTRPRGWPPSSGGSSRRACPWTRPERMSSSVGCAPAGSAPVGHEHQAEQPLAQLVHHHGAQRQRVVPGAAVGVALLVDHHRRHAADGRGVGELAPLHAAHEHEQRVVALVGDHVRRGHADRLGIGEDALRVVLPHLDEAAQVVPAADVGAQQAAPEGPGDGRRGSGRPLPSS